MTLAQKIDAAYRRHQAQLIALVEKTAGASDEARFSLFRDLTLIQAGETLGVARAAHMLKEMEAGQ